MMTRSLMLDAYINEELLRRILVLWKPGQNTEDDALILVKVLRSFQRTTDDVDYATIALGCLPQWTRLLRPYFEEAKMATVPPTVLVRQQLNPTVDSERLGIWDNSCSWRKDLRVPEAFLFCLTCLSDRAITNLEGASKLIPFLIHLAEDYVPDFRIIGANCIRQFLRVTVPKVTTQMQIDLLFHQILMKNFAFESFELKRVSLECLLQDLYTLETLGADRQLAWLEELLRLILKEAAFTKETDIVLLYLEMLVPLVRLLGPATICHLQSLLSLVVDSTGNRELLDRLSPLLLAIFDTAWPRLHGHVVIIEEIMSRFEDAHIDSSLFKERIKLIKQ
ncbi:hypothetical protein PSACC_02166 [Paramicrosporidium saccamoebae]|uniref:Uncharacterized protein n=1 Tax=Paramicrosporidium saccamoebae TaxID=1246581 RepID=A0A2H9TJV6_9FUNG|nr:hypothetical protein PSACC_02166 [Paramicrosporidium saccamoebae]